MRQAEFCAFLLFGKQDDSNPLLHDVRNKEVKDVYKGLKYSYWMARERPSVLLQLQLSIYHIEDHNML